MNDVTNHSFIVNMHYSEWTGEWHLITEYNDNKKESLHKVQYDDTNYHIVNRHHAFWLSPTTSEQVYDTWLGH